MSSSTERQLRSRRKKACDLCFTKKIKCDSREPRCSNCLLYKAECRRTISRHRANPPNPRPVSRRTANVQPNNESLRFGLETFDHSLQVVTEDTNMAHAQTPDTSISPADGLNNTSDATKARFGADHSWKFDPITPRLHYGPPDKHLSLPSLDEIMPMIDHYFNCVNPSIPLFNQSSFMRMVVKWFSFGSKRDTASWAAILVVVGLGLQSPIPGHDSRFGSVESRDWTDYCMRNAQSAVSELVVRDEDLLGIQVLVALAMLFRNAFDIRPSGILLGMAVRLAHRMQLHFENSVQSFTADETLERSNVFWITYMVDKDFSLKTKVPSMLSDADIGIPFDAHSSSNKTGIIWSSDGRSQLNIFHHRLELARIEGKVYDLLYSSRSMKLDTLERQSRVQILKKTLEHWYERIPPAFTIENVSTAMGDAKLLQLTHLYHIYLSCLVSIHGIWSSQAEWMRRIGSLGRAAIEDFATAVYGPKVATCIETQDPPHVDAWNHCVHISRSSLRLFHETPLTPCLIWQNTCAHFSSLIIILSNILNQPAQGSKSQDLQLVMASMELYDRHLEGTNSPVYGSIRLVIDDLRKSVANMVDAAQPEHPTEAQATATPVVVGKEPYVFSEDVVPEFEYHGEQLSSLEFDNILAPYIGEDGIISFLNDCT
ncbi:fungal-specific transcription factor domain-containing protein [Ilyonectria destructans]|nr:fungal-specific transcription factor domain-containing protein [Ilyonectria destructans]